MLKELQKPLQTGTIEFSNGLFGQKINKNSLIICGNPSSTPLEQLTLTVPPKIKTRLILNETGLNGLATTIVRASVIQKLNRTNLAEILNFSNSVNQGIGLPKTRDLIIRTAKKPFYGINRTPVFSEPASLVQNLGLDNEKYTLLTDGDIPRKLTSLQKFLNILQPDTYLMVHDDNWFMQKQSVHGRFVDSNEGAELVIGTNTLHARSLGTGSTDAPFIRINTSRPEYFFRINPQFLESLVSEKKTMAETSYVNIQCKNFSKPNHALRVYEETRSHSLDLMVFYERSVELFGVGSVMEFRLYPPTVPNRDTRLHVLDVNTKF